MSSRPGTFDSLHFYKSYFRNNNRRLFWILSISISMSLLMLPVAFVIRRAFDHFMPNGDFKALALTGTAILFLYFLNSAAAIWNRRLLLDCTKHVIKKVRIDLLHKLFSFPRAFYGANEQSRLHTILVQDTERLDVGTNAFFAYIVPALCMMLVLSGVLVYLNPILFLIVLAAFVSVGCIGKVLSRKTRTRARGYHSAFQSFSSGMLFVLQMMDLTRLQSAEQEEIERQTSRIEDLRQASTRLVWFAALFRVIQDASFALFVILVLVVGGMSVASHRMTLGGLIAFYTVLALLKPQMQAIYTALPQMIEGHEALGRLAALSSSSEAEPYSGKGSIQFSGNVRLDHVHFRYEEKPVLQNFTLLIPRGKSCALKGPNGSGKTTVANLILGFYRPQQGAIYMDDCPLEVLDLRELRSQIGVVSQTPLIFSGTIRENICYGHPDASDEEVERAAELAAAHSFIVHFANGYQTVVGDNGVLLSGGQRQRIVIARALLHQPKFLILDEPTVHLDEASVRHLLKNLRAFDDPPTILIISHESDVVAMADSVYEMRDGHILPEVIYAAGS